MTTATHTKRQRRRSLSVFTMKDKSKAVPIAETAVIDMIKAQQGDKSMRSLATDLGVTVAYLSDIFAGKRSPGPKILQYFGISKKRKVVVEYEFFKN